MTNWLDSVATASYNTLQNDKTLSTLLMAWEHTPEGQAAVQAAVATAQANGQDGYTALLDTCNEHMWRTNPMHAYFRINIGARTFFLTTPNAMIGTGAIVGLWLLLAR